MRMTKLVLALVLALLVAFGVVGIAIAAVPMDTTTALRTSSTLRNAVRVDAIMEHERVFQKIANSNDHTRVSGTPGYDTSAEYVAGKLRAAGYAVTLQTFTFPFFQEVGQSTFERVSPDPRAYVRGNEGYDVMDYLGSGDVTAKVVPTQDVQIPPSPTPSSTSGCEATDFAGFPAGSVALIQRGTCTFGQKVQNAEAAGAIGAIIFNEGQPGRTEVIPGTLSGLHPDGKEWIPVLMTSFAVGKELYDASPGARVSISADTLVENRNTSSIIADYPGGRTDRTLIVGAHLDSVPQGPGINDNGSGTAGILEIALQMKKLGIEPKNHVRFAFWGAEESGPPQWGSQHYVDQLGAAQRKDIALYLNFDMIGSPNFVRFVYDGDGNAFGASGPNGSGTIEKVFRDYFASKGLATEPTPFDGRSDYLPFLQAGIPAGGLISGDAGIKTPQQAAIYGGTAGLAYDSCYHKSCDTINNLNEESIEQLADGAAHATLTFAQTTSAVNGTDKASNTAASKMEYAGPMAVK
jgi:Zn-dependent M28 family amino/carboxypeptidase